MLLDNLFQLDRIKEISAVDGKPTILEVRANGTDAADDLIDRLFPKDRVQFLRTDWIVWAIEGKTLTLVRP